LGESCDVLLVNDRLGPSGRFQVHHTKPGQAEAPNSAIRQAWISSSQSKHVSISNPIARIPAHIFPRQLSFERWLMKAERE
jgi:hypothetical protein